MEIKEGDVVHNLDYGLCRITKMCYRNKEIKTKIGGNFFKPEYSIKYEKELDGLYMQPLGSINEPISYFAWQIDLQEMAKRGKLILKQIPFLTN